MADRSTNFREFRVYDRVYLGKNEYTIYGIWADGWVSLTGRDSIVRASQLVKVTGKKSEKEIKERTQKGVEDAHE